LTATFQVNPFFAKSASDAILNAQIKSLQLVMLTQKNDNSVQEVTGSPLLVGWIFRIGTRLVAVFARVPVL
jgi:hypothetical protein